jgi:polysaccharide export outer membrane protein
MTLSTRFRQPLTALLQGCLPVLLLAVALLSPGCATTPSSGDSMSGTGPVFDEGTNVSSESLVLREGDVVRVAFPGAPNLDSVRTIQRDGKISMPTVGEVPAAGKTPLELQAVLLDLYSPQLLVKEVQVSLESSDFPIFVTGAVKSPGKITSDRPIAVLEAIMECGGPDYTRANLKNVKVIRNTQGRMEHFQVNVRDILDGRSTQPFHLRPSDIIYVPERFSWL